MSSRQLRCFVTEHTVWVGFEPLATERGRLAVHFVEFYSGYARRKSRLTEDFSGFPQFLQARRQDNISIKSQSIPFKLFPIHRSFIALRFCDAVRAVRRPTNRQERGSHSTALRAPADGPTQYTLPAAVLRARLASVLTPRPTNGARF
jgi:hypothetical protein